LSGDNTISDGKIGILSSELLIIVS